MKGGLGLEGRGEAVALGSVTDIVVGLLPCHLSSPSPSVTCQRWYDLPSPHWPLSSPLVRKGRCESDLVVTYKRPSRGG